MSPISIDKEGRMVLDQAVAREFSGRKMDLVSFSPEHLLLAAGDGGEIQLAGRVETISVAELLSFFNMFRKDGILRFQLKSGRKALFFSQGEIVLAETCLMEEEFGEILYSLGKIEREALQKARQKIRDDASLGQALVRQGLITAKDLWHGVRFQIESIVYNLLACQEGSFVFQDWKPLKEKTVRLSLNTQNLIMEGMRRLDERTLFQSKIPSPDAVPVPIKDQPEGLSAAEERMLNLVRAGRDDVRALIRKAGMGDFEGLRLLYHLVEKRVVRVEESPPVSVEGDLGEILQVYNGALSVLFRKVSTQKPDFPNEVKLFLRDLPQPFSFVLRDAELDEDGSVQGHRIFNNLAGLEEGDKRKLLADSLSELVYMECMAARRELKDTEAAGLTQRVQEVVRRVKSLVERTS